LEEFYPSSSSLSESSETAVELSTSHYYQLYLLFRKILLKPNEELYSFLIYDVFVYFYEYTITTQSGERVSLKQEVFQPILTFFEEQESDFFDLIQRSSRLGQRNELEELQLICALCRVKVYIEQLDNIDNKDANNRAIDDFDASESGSITAATKQLMFSLILADQLSSSPAVYLQVLKQVYEGDECLGRFSFAALKFCKEQAFIVTSQLCDDSFSEGPLVQSDSVSGLFGIESDSNTSQSAILWEKIITVRSLLQQEVNVLKRLETINEREYRNALTLSRLDVKLLLHSDRLLPSDASTAEPSKQQHKQQIIDYLFTDKQFVYHASKPIRFEIAVLLYEQQVLALSDGLSEIFILFLLEVIQHYDNQFDNSTSDELVDAINQLFALATAWKHAVRENVLLMLALVLFGFQGSTFQMYNVTIGDDSLYIPVYLLPNTNKPSYFLYIQHVYEAIILQMTEEGNTKHLQTSEAAKSVNLGEFLSKVLIPLADIIYTLRKNSSSGASQSDVSESIQRWFLDEQKMLLSETFYGFLTNSTISSHQISELWDLTKQYFALNRFPDIPTDFCHALWPKQLAKLSEWLVNRRSTYCKGCRSQWKESFNHLRTTSVQLISTWS
jgi:hypothetical protein